MGGTRSGGTTSVGGSGFGPCKGNPQYTCDPNSGNLLVCSEGNWALKQACAQHILCNPNAGRCDLCAVGTQTCDPPTDAGTVLRQCNATGDGYKLATCAPSETCNPNFDHCLACTPGQTRCGSTFNEVFVCASDGMSWGDSACGAGYGCTSTDTNHGSCNYCLVGTSAPLCTGIPVGDGGTKSAYKYCVSGQWQTMDCPAGCQDASATTPASCPQ